MRQSLKPNFKTNTSKLTHSPRSTKFPNNANKLTMASVRTIGRIVKAKHVPAKRNLEFQFPLADLPINPFQKIYFGALGREIQAIKPDFYLGPITKGETGFLAFKNRH